MLTTWIMKVTGVRRLVARLAIGVTVAGFLGGGVVIVDNFFTKKERARVTVKGAKTSVKAQTAAQNVDVEKTLRKICRDC